jgi:hypothetical protein
VLHPRRQPSSNFGSVEYGWSTVSLPSSDNSVINTHFVNKMQIKQKLRKFLKKFSMKRVKFQHKRLLAGTEAYQENLHRAQI